MLVKIERLELFDRDLEELSESDDKIRDFVDGSVWVLQRDPALGQAVTLKCPTLHALPMYHPEGISVVLYYHLFSDSDPPRVILR